MKTSIIKVTIVHLVALEEVPIGDRFNFPGEEDDIYVHAGDGDYRPWRSPVPLMHISRKAIVEHVVRETI